MDINTQLKRDEGEVLHVYLDTKGIRTAGVGHNLEAHGIDSPVGTVITQEQSDEWLEQDLSRAKTDLEKAGPWVDSLDEARYGVLLNMCFNMGWGNGLHGLSAFHNTLAKVQSRNYDDAADAMLESKWAKDVGKRATRLSQQMRTGEWV
jgi:lysozyme